LVNIVDEEVASGKYATKSEFFRNLLRMWLETRELKDLEKSRTEFRQESKNIYKKLDAIVIDEISMVRSDLLDCVDKFMKLNGKHKNLAFGGVQMIFIGDLYQLPPVVTGSERQIFRVNYQSQYFFDAKVFSGFQMDFLELEKIYRQKDEEFIKLLNSIRNNSAQEEHFKAINSRFNPNFEPDPNGFYIYLTTTNSMADELNQKQLAKINSKLFTFSGEMMGDFNLKTLPAKMELTIKTGSQIMMLNNDSESRWVNGSIGKIVGIETGDEEDDLITVELINGEIVKVAPFTWELYKFYYDEKQNKLVSETTGSFTQYPLMLAWAVTIHKSQGKTFDKVIIDIGRGTFTHGQMYVALSRCTTLNGIVLKKPIQKKHIFMDWRIVKFVTRYQYQISEAKLSLNDKIRLIEKAISERQKLQITYLKASDVKSVRTFQPDEVGEMTYLDKKFIGVSGFDYLRQEERVFKVERILEMKEV
jgi:ATP-dependent DNA helicase PIF1